MNGFKKHDIKHSSASQINMYANAPCAWVAKYLYGHKFTFGPAARCGVLIEDAVVNVIARGQSLEEATHKAVSAYNKATAIGASANDLKRGDGIPFMIEEAINQLKQYGEPEFDKCLENGIKQKKIELICKGDGWELPIVGFIDFHYPQHNLIVDLKTTMRLPSKMSDEHNRQGAIYSKAMNCDVKFLYVTPKKFIWHDVEDVDETLAEVKMILKRQEWILKTASKENMRDIIPVNKGSFYWTGDESIRKELYGF